MKNSNKSGKKRISFNLFNAEHIYEYLRFYWEDYYRQNPDDRFMGKFGKCYECESIGKRLEKMIGVKSVRAMNYRLKKHRKDNNINIGFTNK